MPTPRNGTRVPQTIDLACQILNVLEPYQLTTEQAEAARVLKDHQWSRNLRS